jgi:hypothetical protein
VFTSSLNSSIITKCQEISKKLGSFEEEMAKKPEWQKTNVKWEDRLLIWELWAKGYTLSRTVQYLELNVDKYPEAPLDRDTINKVRDEWFQLPQSLRKEAIKEKSVMESLLHEKESIGEDRQKEGLNIFIKEQMKVHIEDLTVASKDLVRNMMLLPEFVRYIRHISDMPDLSLENNHMRGNIIDGGRLGLPFADGTFDDFGSDDVFMGYHGAWEFEKIDILLADCLLEHFKHRFPDIIDYSDWRKFSLETFNQEVIDKLQILIRSKNFGICPRCPICGDIQA